MEDAFVGIDVSFAKNRKLPIVVCCVRSSVLEPLPLRSALSKPPVGEGNARTLDPEVLNRFAQNTVAYLRSVELEFNVRVKRVAIDSPSEPRRAETTRRECEVHLDRRRISCITTPSLAEFDSIKERAAAHLAAGGAQSRIPGANQLWMLVGFALFERLRSESECLEVYPQAIASVLGASKVHKKYSEGRKAQFAAVARYTNWPKQADPKALGNIGYGSTHDRLDAYLSAWISSLPEAAREVLGRAPDDAIWVPRMGGLPN